MVKKSLDSKSVDSAYVDGNTVYYPTTKRLKSSSETVVTNFQSGHGFTKWSAAGTQSDDTTVYHKGAQSMKHVTDGLGSTIQSRKSITSTDFTGKYLKLWVRFSDVTHLASIRVRLSSDTFTNYYDFQINSASTIITDSNTWQCITLPFGAATSTGTPNRAAIINLAVLCTDDNTGNVINVWWGGLSTFAENTEGIVTFRFDDGWASQYTRGKPVLDSYNYKATFFIIPDFIDTTLYMTTAQMQDLYLDGHDISCHHQTNYTTFTNSVLENVLKKTKKYFLDKGINKAIDFVAYPNGGINETILPIIKKYLRAGTIVTTAPHETLPPGDAYRIRIMNVTASTAPATITAAIATAVTNKEWLILMLHDIVASGATGNTQYNKADLQTVVDYCYTNNVKVLPFGDVWNNF